MSRLRTKLRDSEFEIRTLRNTGYYLVKKGVKIPKLISSEVPGTLPTNSYLGYMNDPKNTRKVLKDLFSSLPLKDSLLKGNVLVINSYSYDNVDALAQKYPKSDVFFSNFDQRALNIHQERIEKLKLNTFHAIYDDIRSSILKNNLFNLVINDFRLNFNTSNSQNWATM